MTRTQIQKLKILGVHIQNITYSYPDEQWLKEVGFWNYEEYKQRITVSVNLEFETVENARNLERNLLILAKAQASDNPAVQNLLNELETLLELTK